MVSEITDTALFRFLVEKDKAYYGKIDEQREVIKGWLEYIPETFPHYTRHTIGHSEAIITQLSHLLFPPDSLTPTVNLSSVEVYILIVAAYLHDSGMVASDEEKQKILESDGWKKWTGQDGGGTQRWREIKEMRDSDEPDNQVIRNFIADREVRFMIADFVRRRHHERAGDVISQHQSALGRFAYDDPQLERTIANVCIAHGLPPDGLDDRTRFPILTQIRGENVNTRLMAILLRLGDLLDMGTDRACPLLLNAACPLPDDSYAHWTKYRSISHRAVTPEKIEVNAECGNPEEHRVLRDWCQWIVNEVEAIPNLLADPSERKVWEPPVARMAGSDPTIKIVSAPDATYQIKDWRFQLDETEVMNRLIFDAYEDEKDFVRELIQNALDAMRCRMYEDLKEAGKPTPRSPTLVPAEVRERYRLRLSITGGSGETDGNGNGEEQRVLVIDDCGIGMDEQVISHHLLQIGLSYYTTEDFRQRYAFTPTSRFGVGFLSVFGVSNHVTVETFKPSSESGDNPVKLTLNGPRGYLVVEDGDRTEPGTRIEVLLRPDSALNSGQLTAYVRELCRRVEFTIEVDDFGQVCEITAERGEEFTFDVEDIRTKDCRFVLKSFPVVKKNQEWCGIEGDLYVLCHVDASGNEDWSKINNYIYYYKIDFPQVESPEIPKAMLYFHGVVMHLGGFVGYKGNKIHRIDIRDDTFRPPLSRRSIDYMHYTPRVQFDPSVVTDRWVDILSNHLSVTAIAKGQDGWAYKQRLSEIFDIEDFWVAQPKTVPIVRRGKRKLISLQQACEISVVVEILDSRQEGLHDLIFFESPKNLGKTDDRLFKAIEAAINPDDRLRMCEKFTKKLFSDRQIQKIEWIDEIYLAIYWQKQDHTSSIIRTKNNKPIYIAEKLPRSTTFAFKYSRVGLLEHVAIISLEHPVGGWIVKVITAFNDGDIPILASRIENLTSFVRDAICHTLTSLDSFNNYQHGWNEIPDLPNALKAPVTELTMADFGLISRFREKEASRLGLTMVDGHLTSKTKRPTRKKTRSSKPPNKK